MNPSGEVRPTLIANDFVSPAILIIQLLKDFKNIDEGSEREKRIRCAKIDYIYGRINTKSELYKVDPELSQIIAKARKSIAPLSSEGTKNLHQS